MIDVNKFAKIVGDVGGKQYENRINFLKDRRIETASIENAIKSTIESVSQDENISFVIFGEPQSGKTEMMIALNAKLLDLKYDVVINLVTDSVDLLEQNLSRFKSAGISPSPREFSALPTNVSNIKGKQWVIFSKKNAKDLEKLKESIRFVDKVVVIDDEADYASPNSKINTGEMTKINSLINDIIKGRGIYIGVTATPARLDLNNTFSNKTEHWVDFSPHTKYVGQDFFFPQDGKISYRLHQFDTHSGNERVELKNAILNFMCGVAHQHELGNKENFSMIVHTSGKKSEHREDFKIVEETIFALTNTTSPTFGTTLKRLNEIAKEFDPVNPENIVEFVIRNINKNQIVEINSNRKNQNIEAILKPKSLFSFGVGGNIISRGVTFDNLLSMYFTRTVKGKFTQDTYIQRARMFGSRDKYKNDFQLWVPKDLLINWTQCFAFHKLAIEAARSGSGAPVWLSDHRSAPTSSASIDRSSVDFEGGEMSFALFDFDAKIQYMGDSTLTNKERFELLRRHLTNEQFPQYVYNYICMDDPKYTNISFHNNSEFGARRTYAPEEIKSIRRKKGAFATTEYIRSSNPNAKHHLKVFYNGEGKARLFYKINGTKIKFVQNRR